MLEGLDLIEWGKLRHAYGPATDVPGLLRDLAAIDAGVRDAAMHELCGNIHHQSDVYEASAYAVPFLVELLTHPDVQDKSSILSLLEALANGYNYLSFRDHPGGYERHFSSEEWETRQQYEHTWTAAAHQAVLEYVPAYLQSLDEEAAEVRQMAAYVLSACFERASEIIPALQQQLLIDADPAAQSTMVMALTRLWKLANRWGVSQPLSKAQMIEFLRSLAEGAGLPALARFVLILALVDLGDHAMRDRLFTAFATDGEQCLDEFERLRLLWEEDSSLIGAISMTFADQPDIQQQWLIQLLNHPNTEVRCSTIYAVAEVCYIRRSAPAIFAPHLVPLVADSDKTVRKSVFHVLIDLGKARLQLIEPLQRLCQHPEPAIAQDAQELLSHIAQRNSLIEQSILKQWPPRKALQDKSLDELMQIVEQRLHGTSWQVHDCQSALIALGQLGPSARVALPLITQALNHRSPDIGVWGAYALWHIDQNVTDTVPILQEALHLQYWPWATLMAVETLGEMGRHGQVALPKLREFVTAELRPRDAALGPFVDGDELLQLVAQQAVTLIEADLARPEH